MDKPISTPKLDLTTPLTELQRVGPTTAAALKRLGLLTARDLLLYSPYRYLDFSKFTAIADITPGEIVTIRGHIKTISSRYSFRGRMSLAEGIISDDTGSLKVVWFNQPYLAKTLQPGDDVLLSGTPTIYKTLQLQNPIYEKHSEHTLHTGRLVPVYHATENLYNRTIRSLVHTCLPLADRITDDIPAATLQQYHLPSFADTIRTLHFPSTETELQHAQRRAIFDEILVQQLAVQSHQRQLAKAVAPPIAPDVALIKQFLATLPFALTAGQKRAIWDITQDIARPRPMNRLLEGDVGSGKTLVALVAALQVMATGQQVVLLAPTEILAQQHYETFLSLLQHYPHPLGLLTRTFRRANGQTVTLPNLKETIASGDIRLLIGTHAVLQNITFKNLAFIVIDEQQRFGVEQRGALLRGATGTLRPHLLPMTATPIPRTLALSLYSDLTISQLTQLPHGRKPITTKIVGEPDRVTAYAFIRRQIENGRQAFIVVPRVEDNDASTLKSAKQEIARLQTEVFPDLKIALIHGKMKGSDKELVMQQFADREFNILVATSVIEIGIDIPNATVMVIEDADRFGLAQLHQLRGRVGRSAHQSYCLLFTQNAEEKTLERLQQFSRLHNGFKLAELDLKQRGFGSLFGTQQSGFDFKWSRWLTMGILKDGQQAARTLLNKDESLHRYPTLAKKVAPLLDKIHLE